MIEELGAVALSPRPEDNCLQRIQNRLEQLNGSVRRVAEYVLASPWETRGISIVELARRVGVSENSVSRFCSAIGYAGYRDFASQLAMTLGRISGAAYATPPEVARAVAPGDGVFQIVSNVFAMEMQCLQETLHQLDRRSVEAAVNALNGARKVLFIGMGATVPAASTGAYRLALLGIDAVWLSDPYAVIAQVGLYRTGDVVFGISFHGRTRPTGEALKIARANGATTICLTTAPGSPLARNSDICLTVANSIPLYVSRQFSARVAGALLVDAMAAAVAWDRHQGTPPGLLKTFELQRSICEYGQTSPGDDQ